MKHLPGLFLCLAAASCATKPKLRTEPPRPPLPGGSAGFRVGEIPAWSLIGNDLTLGNDLLELEVEPPGGTRFVEAWPSWFSEDAAIRLTRDGDVFRVTLDIRDVAPGRHEIRYVADDDVHAFASSSFTRTHPLYVLTSTDWDTADNPDANLERHEELHRRHRELKITHLVGPYTFTDLTLSEERVQELTSWVLRMRERYGDEIGVHIHPYKNFVEAAGIPFRAEPTNSGTPDPTGYRVDLTAYSEAELATMFEFSTALFEENGLGTPTAFRAGAWNANIEVLRALGSAGYRVDSSALNWSRLEEWRGLPLFEWVEANWAPIDDLSQPYYPNEEDIHSVEPPLVPVLELPDNGVLVDYVTGAEMIDVFRRNWPEGPLHEPRALSIGWHPPNFGPLFMERIDEALTEFDRYLASEGAGPVVYANLTDMVQVWRLPTAP